MGRFGDPEPLTEAHEVEGFDAGVASLSTWVIEHALARAGSGRTFVVTDADQGGRFVGYHAIAAASRLAVDRSVQGRGVGAWLLQDAMRRALSASEEFRVRIVLVHAIDKRARAFYERFGFESSPTDPLNLQLLIKDIRKSLGLRGSSYQLRRSCDAHAG